MNRFFKQALGVLTLAASALPVAATPTIYGLVAKSDDLTPGIYSFEPTEDLNLTAVQLSDADHDLSTLDGAVYHDGKYEIKNFSSHRTFDTNSWAMIHECTMGWPANMSLAAKSVIWDKVSGNIYGCFTDTGSWSYVFGTIDYEKSEMSPISNLSDTTIEDMFATPEGDIYGILNNGMLVKIDKETGNYTAIGDTGMIPFGYHAGVVDPDSGTAYWALSTEEGSGLYELDLTDGSVVLISEFPSKAQITGLYIESASTPVPPTPVEPSEDTVIYGLVAKGSGSYPMGIYSFEPSEDLNLTAVQLADADHIFDTMDGVVYHDGKYEIKNFTSHRTFDTESWAQLHECTLVYPKTMELAAKSAVWDPATGNVYACLTAPYSMDHPLMSFRLATIDYENKTYEEIRDLGSMDDWIDDLFVTPAGELYGVLNNGMLVRIDKESGEFTQIGDTGMIPSGFHDGVVDPASGKAYWALSTADGSGLYELDLTDGSVVLISEFPSNIQLTGLYMPSVAVADADVPALASDLVLNFIDDSLEGSLTFKAPELSEGGEKLKNDMQYVVKMNDEEVASGTASPGADVTTESFTLPASGSYLMALTLSNAAGESKVAYMRQYIGHAMPEAVSDVVLVFDGDKANVSWKPSTSVVGDGYFDINNISYDVIRYPEGVVVAEKIKTNAFSEDVDPIELVPYCYGVVAYNGDAKGNEVKSETVNHGVAVNLPYFENFEDRSGFDLYTIIDGNNDGNIWDLNEYSRNLQYYSGMSSRRADDWVVTPAFKLEKSKIYSFAVKAVGTSSFYSQDLDVAIGKQPTVKALDTTLVPRTGVTEEEATLDAVFTVEEDGVYYIGIHTDVPTGVGMLEVYDISLKQIATVEGPGAAEGLYVTPGEKGALSAEIGFAVPSKTYSGNALSAIEKVELLRDDEVINTWEAPAIGAKLTYEDKEVENGKHAYTVVAYNGNGAGYPAVEKRWIGIDVPSAVTDVTLVEKGTKAVLSWTPVAVGAHGGYVDIDALTYSIQNSDGETVAVGYKNTTYGVEIPDVDYQFDLAFAIIAVNEQGNSVVTVSPALVLGPDYLLPFEESFPRATTEKYWSVSGVGTGVLGLTDAVAVDGDGGSVAYQAGDDYAEGELVTGRIDFTGADEPGIELYVALLQGAISFEVLVEKANGDRSSVVAYELDQLNAWYHILLPLEIAAGEKSAKIVLKCISDSETTAFIDGIRIREGISEVSELAADSVKVFTQPGKILINGAEGLDVIVTTLDGKLVSSFKASGSEELNSDTGLYLVKVGKRSFKVIVK